MLKIRLQRVGKKHDPSFRVVLVDSRRGPRSGNFLEVLGSYNAQKGKPELNAEKIKEWTKKGAQLSDTVHNLLVSTGAFSQPKINVLPKNKKKKNEAKPAEIKPEETKPAEEKEAKTEEAAAS